MKIFVTLQDNALVVSSTEGLKECLCNRLYRVLFLVAIDLLQVGSQI